MPIADLLAGLKDKFAGKQKEEERPASQDGNVPPTAGLTEAQKLYGPNFEQLKEKRPDIVGALQSLVFERRLADIWAQRRKIRRIRMARDFWQGNQYSSYDGDAYSSPAGLRANMDFDDPDIEETGPRYQFVTNFYQAYGLGFCAVMSQDVPHPEFYPGSRERQEDITFAKVVDDVVDEIERNNKPKSLLVNIANRFWTDGIIVGHVRYVVDGERFGYKTLPVQGTQESDLGGVPVTLPTDQGEEQIPNGQEVITIYGGLEAAVPNYADDFHECEYVQINVEPAISRLKAAFPHAADGIESDSGLSADQVYERIARLGVKQNVPYLVPGDALNILATFSRTWLRKWAFESESVPKPLREELKQLYPHGCYVAFAGLQYCESRDESMDKHIRVKNALPGDGQSRPAVGGALIDVQDRYNELANIQAETYSYGVPPVYEDPGTVNPDAVPQQVSEPGTHQFVRARAGLPLEASFYQPAPAETSSTLAQTMQELMGPVAQFLCGLFPAIFGGEMEDVKTAKGYAMARDQAMGRLGLIWRVVQEVYFELMFLAVMCFKENRPDDVEVPFSGETDEEKAKWIRKGDLQGNIMLKGEPDADMPRMKGEQRAILQQLFALADNPLLQEVFTEPANLGLIKEIFGLQELEIPGDDSRVKQMRETQMLLEGEPFQAPPIQTMQEGPNGPMPASVEQPPQPTVGVGKYDRHDVELMEGLRYWSSDQGQEQARSNPKGWLNFTLHLDMHAQAIAEKAAQNKQTIPPKPPSMSVKVEDLPPNAAAQALAQDNIQVDPAELAAKSEQNRQDKAAELQAKLANKKPAESVA